MALRAVLGGLLRRGGSPASSTDADRAGRLTDVFVIAPIRLHRESIAARLDAVAGLRVIGGAATLAQGLEQLHGLARPAVALLDAPHFTDGHPPAPRGEELEAKIVAVGVSERDAVAWIEAGVSGFVAPDASIEEVTAVLHTVATGQLAASPQVTAHLASRVRTLAAELPDSIAAGTLTSRELEILDLLDEGLSNKQIGQRLSIQEQTAKNHVHNVLVKLGVKRRAEAAARARRRRQSRDRELTAMPVP
jgi:two-component system, NarL family, nitrate/nitrite response regulator NarL